MQYNAANIETWRIAAKDNTRPEIASVLLAKDKTVATDSFKLVEVSVPKDAPDIEEYPAKSMRGMSPVIVDAKAFGTIKIKANKTLPSLQNMTVKHVDNERVEFNVPSEHGGDGEDWTTKRTFRRIDGTYPDYQQIIPKGKPAVEVNVNADYLIDLLKVLKKSNAMHDKSNKRVTIKLWGELEPIEITNSNEQQPAKAYLMPIQN